MVAQPDTLESGGRLINGDTRPGKKMKKRRELDALVGKTRRKNRGGHELLRNDSESSEIEEFSSQDSKITVRNRRGGSFCGTCLTVLTFLLLLACIIACAGLVWVHLELKTELDTLRGRVQSVESKNQNMPSQWEALKQQVQDCNKSLTSLRTGDKGLEEVIKNLTEIGAEVKSLKTKLTELNTKLASSPAKSEINIDVLKKSLATIGSKVETLENTQSDFQKDQFNKLQERVKQLEEKSSLISLGVNPSLAPVVVTEEEKAAFKQQLDQLRESAELTNSSISVRLDQIVQELAAHQSHFDALDSSASTPHVAINTSVIMESVRGQLIPYIQALVKNSSHSIAPTFDLAALEAIKSQVKNISIAVLDLQQQMSSSPGVDPPDLQAMQTQINTTNSKLESVNVTMVSLQRETAQMMELYVQEKNTIVELTHNVDGVKRFIATQHNPPKDKNGSTPVTETTTTDNSTASPSTPTDDQNPTTKKEKKRGVESDLNKELKDIFE